MSSKKELLERLEAIEKKQKGTARALKNVEDIQAGIGLSALGFQRFKTYLFAIVLGLFGIGYIIYAAVGEKDTDNKETDYVVGGLSLLIAILSILAWKWYSGSVKNDKKMQVFNAYLFESQMFAKK